ncbi:replication protein A 32 kDa subunit-A-like isoform X2 [Varroa jacobsoni]|uniref:Replication protein A C-terminal domain-containing protein n=1 Tax=Varroa destructor TaxID=109461 RepID=A0A7M7JL19_VARDE|nr:replication protein A 32 kDa subunit-A-like isoform X2 [Varroa destructor]XP_022708973.1 replication protein A 32 kDa subunit-A-like isoform X2 [Varroa jacobsoni]
MDVYAEAGGFDVDASINEGKRERGGRGPQNLTPLTCADIQRMSGEKWTFHNHQAEKVCLVGIVRSYDTTAMRVTLVIDDRLGPPVICQSMDVNDQELERISDGMYVKIFGHLRKQSVNKEEDMKVMITVIKIRALSSINEVFKHSLECTHAKLSYLTVDKRSEQILSKVAIGGQRIGAGGTAASVSTIDLSSIGSSGVSGLNRNQEMVYCAIREGGPLGINIEKVATNLAAHGLKSREVRDAVEFLANEGHVYTTIDDETYATVDNE